MTVAGFTGSWAPWLAVALISVVAAVAIGVLMRHGRGEHIDPHVLCAVPICGFGVVAGLLLVLVPYLVILPPTTEPVVMAAMTSKVWQTAAVMVGAMWLSAMCAAVATVRQYHEQRRTGGSPHA